MGARNDFFNHGGKLINTRVHGKIWFTCVACKYKMPMFKRVMDRASSPKCPACGWQMEPSKASREKNKRAHAVQAERGEGGGVIQQKSRSKTGKHTHSSGRRRGK